jgi:hypothetical protein
MMELCQLISQGQDAGKFQKLVMELNQLLAQKEQILKKEPVSKEL